LFGRLLARIRELWERTEAKDRRRFLIIAGVVLAIIIVAVILLNQKTYVPLYQNLDTEQAQLITARLDELGAGYRLDGAATILVAEQDLARLTIDTAGVVPNLTTSLDIFAQGAALGSSEYQQKMYAKFQAEATVANMLRTNLGVRSASVSYNIPDNSFFMFEDERQEITAAVMLYMYPGATLTPEQVEMAVNLVASMVGMDPKNVTITDDSFNRLNNFEDNDYSTAETAHELEAQLSQDVGQIAQRLVQKLYGEGRVSVGATVHVDWAEREEERQTFAPVVDENGLPRSVHILDEEAVELYPIAGEPGIDENGGDEPAEYPEVQTDNTRSWNRHEEETNYEMNSVIETVRNTKGTEITHLSLSVMVDNNDTDPETGEPRLRNETITPEMLTATIANAVGILPEDYDHVTVQFGLFEERLENEAMWAALEAQEAEKRMYDLIRVLALYGVILIALIVLIIGLLRLFRKKPTPEELAAQAEADAAADAAELGDLLKLATQSSEELEEKKTPQHERIEEFIDKNPEAVAQLLRTWLSDEGERKRR
jgi:flagellar M-ring protein FliF